MLAVYAENQNPREYGFEYADKQLAEVARKMRYSEDKMFGALRYAPIQQAMQKNCKKEDLPREIRWFYDASMDNLGQVPLWRKCARKIKRRVKKIIGGR